MFLEKYVYHRSFQVNQNTGKCGKQKVKSAKKAQNLTQKRAFFETPIFYNYFKNTSITVPHLSLLGLRHGNRMRSLRGTRSRAKRPERKS